MSLFRFIVLEVEIVVLANREVEAEMCIVIQQSLAECQALINDTLFHLLENCPLARQGLHQMSHVVFHTESEPELSELLTA